MKLKCAPCNRLLKGEENVSRHINIIGHYADDALLDKSGKLIKIIKVSGLNFSTLDEETLNSFKFKRNNLLKSFSSEFALYFYQLRRKYVPDLIGEYESHFAKEFHEKYLLSLKQNNMFHTELYLAIMTKQPEGLINKGFSLAKTLFNRFDKTAHDHYLAKSYEALNDATRKILSSLADYGCELLSVKDHNGIMISEPLAFLSTLINFDYFNVPLVKKDASSMLSRKRISFNARRGLIELRDANEDKKLAAIISIKNYSAHTDQGMLQALSDLNIEYTFTQSYRFFDKQIAKSKMRDQQKEMAQSNEESQSQTEDLDDTYDETAGGNLGFGIHHFCMVCYADTESELNQNIAAIIATLSDIDITSVREDIATEYTFWAQMPGNFSYIARAVPLSTKNIAALASLHNYPIGKKSGNHWGEAVTVLETISGSPYYFNFHYKDVGNFQIYGATGSGKTVLIGFLLLQSLKFNPRLIIGDKDRGFEILVRALNGEYMMVKPGIPTGFNPCQLPDTPENRKFLCQLFTVMLAKNNETLSYEENAIIEQAVSGLYDLPIADRQLRHLAPFFGTPYQNELRNKFDEWHSDGSYAWMFDNPQDTLTFDKKIFAFGLDHILADKNCSLPFCLYFIYKAREAVKGERGIFFFDEAWQVLAHPYLRNLLNDASRTNRKNDNILGLATQLAGDIYDPSVSKAIAESAFCKMFFPNSSADHAIYVEQLGLTESEYELIKTLPDDQHYFLLVHGRNTNKESVVVRANLKYLQDELAIISANEKTLAILDELLLTVGKDPNVWLPIFKERIKIT